MCEFGLLISIRNDVDIVINMFCLCFNFVFVSVGIVVGSFV